MKRFSIAIALIAAAVSSIVWAAAVSPATLITPAGAVPVRLFEQGGQILFSADDLVKALGGTVSSSENSFKATLGTAEAAFGTDSRVAVVSDTMVELPVTPVAADGTVFIPLELARAFVKPGGQSLAWNAADRTLRLQQGTGETVAPQISVVNLQDLSKVVIQLAAPAEYSIARDASTYTIRFKQPLQAPFAEQKYEDPHVSSIVFLGSDLKIQLMSPEVAGSAYRLDNPFRIVIDLQKGVPPITPGPALPPEERRAEDRPGIRTIVLDPGHGGKDVGAVGATGLLEKDATLAIASKLSSMLSRSLNVRVILTRSNDSAVSLDQRTAIANQYKGDLFLSIHLNAAKVKGARGSETYFLSLDASDELARKAAERENQGAGAAVAQSPASDLRLILWDLAQQDHLKESSHLAEAVQEEMDRASGLQNRGVKQAPFKVLVGATMPAALVEVCFISNGDDEAKLRTEEFQSSIAKTLAGAIERYKREYDARNGLGPPPVAVPAPAAAASNPPVTSSATP